VPSPSLPCRYPEKVPPSSAPHPSLPFLFPRPFPPSPTPHTKLSNTCLALLTNSPHQKLSACASGASRWWHIPVFRLHRNCRENRYPLEFHGVVFPRRLPWPASRVPNIVEPSPAPVGNKNTTQNLATLPTAATRLSRPPLPRTRRIDGARRPGAPDWARAGTGCRTPTTGRTRSCCTPRSIALVCCPQPGNARSRAWKSVLILRPSTGGGSFGKVYKG